ncbi:unnamed protein product (macronuclear) [Paramecium tetraurelia]|uniref:Uncharacterized protein n=1 Tax=Paramecium tetraurelia TaxID=5888 RepID=A0E2N5_PARTE|nr:uncharacterized protein GSPATT00022724001 [Paramecium tetraurelia]CAK89552.1 unnamed protein product [Paramecium tetraurelia]|eukprot:XP_001456949.1 hypothetical protein (macronuclear) [Paramecium tetraurelia strain d4-2]
MSYLFFELDDPLNPSTLNNLEEKSLFEVCDQQEREKGYSSLDSIQNQNQQNKSHQEAKNIPKNMGVLIKNYFINNYKDLARQNITIKKFISKVNNKKNYTRKDLKVLFSNEQARFICKEYFSSFQIIKDILKSTKISDSEVVLKYVKKLFIGTQDPQSLSSLKYSNYDF